MESKTIVEAIPVVLLHGALRSRAGLWITARILTSHGLAPRSFGYRTRHGTLAEHAAALDDALSRWFGQAAPLPVLGFVTHSMGALVLRTALAAVGGSRHALEHRVVMLSPPNRGATLARRFADFRPFHWLYGDAARILCEGPEPQPLPANVRVLILGGGEGKGRRLNRWLDEDNDGVVAVSDMQLEGGTFARVRGVHALLQWQPAVVRRAAHFIATGVECTGANGVPEGGLEPPT